jgi:hypothetical protein
MEASPFRAGAGPRRFEATAWPGRRAGMLVAGASLVVVMGVSALGALLPKELTQIVLPVVLLGFIVLYGVLFARVFRGTKVRLDVDGGRVLVDEGRGGAFPLAGAQLGPMRLASIGVISGSALHLSDGTRPYRIGGTDHRPYAGARLDAPAVEEVDVSLPAPEFAALLALARPAVGGFGRDTPASLRCALLPNPSSARSAFRMMAPWLGTMVLVGLVSGGLGALGLYDTMTGQYVGAAVTIPMLIGGLVLTAVLGARRAPQLEIEIEAHQVRLRDPRSGATLAAAPWGAITVGRGVWRMNSRAGSHAFPCLALGVPGHAGVTFAVYDMRYAWRDGGPKVSAPRYVVGAPDWNALVERLGLAEVSVVGEGGWGAG